MVKKPRFTEEEVALMKYVDKIEEEVNEPVDTITFKRWQVGVAALALTVLLLVVIL